MHKNPALINITTNILACRRCRQDPSTFIDGESVLGTWAPPRGWAGEIAKHADIVLVGLNPGFPLPNESAKYQAAGLSEANVTPTTEQLDAVFNHCISQYRSPGTGQNWVFHRKSVAFARAILWILDRADPGESLWRRVWFTDVFKCSTKDESKPKISRAAEKACIGHLRMEIGCLSPKLIVALGGQTSAALKRAGIRHIRFRHPSNGCPRLDNECFDSVFEQVAEELGGLGIPDDFLKIREKIHSEALQR